MDPFYLVILPAVALSFALGQLNVRLASPLLAILDRWLRWLVFAFGTALICQRNELLDRPYWTLAAAFFLLWFLAETLYNWLAITAHSVSSLPLFPRYAVNASGEEWPVQPRLLKLREWLRAQGFRQMQALKLDTGDGAHLRVSIYQDAPATLRVQVTGLVGVPLGQAHPSPLIAVGIRPAGTVSVMDTRPTVGAVPALLTVIV